MSIYFKRRQIVLPGELLAEGENFKPGEGTFKEGDRIFSAVVGLAEIRDSSVTVVPLEGGYIPKPGDTVIGKIVDVKLNYWDVDILAPYLAVLNPTNIPKPVDPTKTDLRRIYDVGDLIVAKILAFDRTQPPMLTMKEKGLRKLEGGRLVKMAPTRIPRLIGKRGSMINMIKKQTGCQIVIGQNGLIWISGEDPEKEELVIKAIRQIEREAHTSGLTDRIRELISKKVSQ
ncbi:MAG: exosome complex RNA-binding protein Rrp4 [Candidatus Jordarchaeales archaeon]